MNNYFKFKMNYKILNKIIKNYKKKFNKIIKMICRKQNKIQII